MKARYFVIIALLSIGFGGYQLAHNRVTADGLQNAITAKDTAGTDSTAEQAQLGEFAAHHMQSGRTVVLTGAYNRAKAAAQAAGQSQANGGVYAQAQAACAGHADSITQARCVTAYVSSHAAPAANPQPVVLPNQADYTKTFPSPAWLADGTGISLLVGGVAIVGAVFLSIR